MKKIALCLLIFCGCATIRAMSGPFAACGKADLGQLIPTATAPSVVASVLDVITEIVDANRASLESELASAAITAGVDAVKCAIAAYNAVKTATPAAGSGAVMVASVPPGLPRARAWAASK